MWTSTCKVYGAAQQIYPEFSGRVLQSESLTPRTLLTVVPSAIPSEHGSLLRGERIHANRSRHYA
jgi:hypothetical protein